MTGAAQGKLLRWYLSYGTFGIPVAAGPIAYALAALALTGNATDGAQIVLAMTVAQVIGAVPVARLGRRLNAVGYLRLLIGLRTVAVAAIAMLFYVKAPFFWLSVAAIGAGLVNGAAYGYMRSILNGLVGRERLPRALGIASTLNEVTFVSAPVMASLLGSISPMFGLIALAVLSAAPAMILPSVDAHAAEPPKIKGAMLSAPVLLWLLCAATNGAVIASVEIGAVALALRFGFAPEFGALFTVSLCVASIAGGLWVSIRNRMPRRWTVIGYLAVLTTASILLTLGLSVALTAIGAFMAGLVLAPLTTYYSLMLDNLTEPHRHAEMFALLRTANSIGVMLASGMLAYAGLTSALSTGMVLAVIATSTVVAASLVSRKRQPQSPRKARAR